METLKLNPFLIMTKYFIFVNQYNNSHKSYYYTFHELLKVYIEDQFHTIGGSTFCWWLLGL